MSRLAVVPFAVLSLAVAPVLSLAGSAHARQDLACPDTDEITACILRLQSGSSAEPAEGAILTQEQSGSVAAGLAEAAAGRGSQAESVDPFGARFAGTLKNFLPLFNGLASLDSVSEDGRSVTIDLNPSLEQKPLQLQATFRRPELFDQLEARLTELELTDLISELEGGFEDTDDVEVSATYLVTRRHTRLLDDYHDLFAILVRDVSFDAAAAARAELNELVVRVQEKHPDLEESPTVAELKEVVLPGEDLAALFEAAANTQVAFEASVLEAVSLYFEPFAKAVNNQSQLYVTGSRLFRPDPIGPDTSSFEAAYEIGFANVRSLRRKAGCPNQPLIKCEVKKVKEALADWSAVNAGHRLKLSASYQLSDDLLLPIEEQDPFALNETSDLTFSVAYGRYLGSSTRAPRLDVELSFEDLDSAAERRGGSARSVLSKS